MPDLRRRDLLWSPIIAATSAWAVQGATARKILIDSIVDAGFQRKLASREILRGLTRLGIPNEIRFADAATRPSAGDLVIAMRVEPKQFKSVEAYSVATSAPNRLTLT